MITARQKQGLIRLILTGSVVILIAALAIIQLSALRQSQRLHGEVEASYQRDLLYERLLSLHQDVETGQRGFSLTGNPDFLQPYERALPRIASTFVALDRAVSDPAARAIVNRVRTVSAAKIAHSARVIEVRRRGTREEAAGIIGLGEGRRIMESLRVEIGRLRSSEARRQNRLLGSLTESDGSTFGWTVAIELVLVSLLILAYAAYLRGFRRLISFGRRMADASRRQAAIFDAAGDAMLVVDEDGSIEGLNPAAHHLFALKRDAMVGKSIDELFERDKPYILGRNERRSRIRPGAVAHAVGLRGDGSTFEAEIASSTVNLEDDALRTLLVIRDSTERNRVERMKNQFVSTVSHELRTPLTSIRGAIGLLDHDLKATATDRQAQLLGIARSNSERLSLLIDDILDIEKLNSGRLEFDMQAIDVRDVVADAEEHNRTFAADRKVRLVVTCQTDPLPIVGDPSRLLQALTNLISNAAKFSPEGGVVSVIAEKQADVARVIVADHGPGIPVDFRTRIFDRFSQAEKGSNRSGTGLGLAITKEIVERHGGQVDFESTIGRGTRFFIDLPLVDGGRK